MFTQDQPRLRNWINGQFVDVVASGSDQPDKTIPVTSPYNARVIGHVPLSNAADVAVAVAAAQAAFPAWSSRTIKDRAAILIKFHSLLTKHVEQLADMVVLEHGKNKAEAIASVLKGQETVEYALSLPQVVQGKMLEVSRGITCYDTRVPLGVIASVVPFNFPVMVPMWTLPIAIAMGNTMVLKPSEKVPFTMTKIVELLKEAGLPDGVVNLVHGTANAVNALIDHEDVKAVTFVGTSHIAEMVSQRCHKLNKRVLALGGAKNHMISAPDRNIEMTSTDVVNSYSGCSGQRCMAATVLLTIGHQQELVDKIVAKSEALRPGSKAGEVGPVIDQASVDKITRYINEAEASGARILVDGRPWTKNQSEGFWVGPTVILHTNKQDAALHDEIFGPVLSILAVDTAEEALAIENANPYGNAACIYTSSGATADHFIKRFSAGMCGVNIGVAVPREPFSFGGWNKSRFGNHCDITGDGGVEFFSMRRKVTTKWVPQENASWMNRMMTFSTAPQEANYLQTQPRAIFLDSGGVINDNDRRAPQWEHHLEQYMPTTKLGGPGRLWGKSNAIMWDRLFNGENSLWKQLIDRSKDFHQFYREYHLFWIQEGVRLVNKFLKEEYDEAVKGSRGHGGDGDDKEIPPLVQLVLPESEKEQIQIAYDAHLYCTSIVRADYPGAVEAILELKFEQGFTMYTCSGESAPELELALKTLGMSTLLVQEEKKAADRRSSTITPQATTDICIEEAAEAVVRPVFTKLYGPDLIQCHKGSSEFYRRIFEDSGVDARDAVVVDDKEYILAWAKVHGARTVLISTKDRRGKEMVIEMDKIQVDGTVAKVVVPVVDDQLESLSQLPALTASWKRHPSQ
ncbi:hypothetical protein BG015_010342 [Linnemannia schmuckeri]|uniref:Aldehyde dehydrogenase domain-containing protein n=1 Tax=Linnemannia schmuckeri TaxID=64567 RepID=A0A9P5S7H7_9FUNG|nr:hypothetical protein BG015_010342 [Linnemannia schmuckeri]